MNSTIFNKASTMMNSMNAPTTEPTLITKQHQEQLLYSDGSLSDLANKLEAIYKAGPDAAKAHIPTLAPLLPIEQLKAEGDKILQECPVYNQFQAFVDQSPIVDPPVIGSQQCHFQTIQSAIDAIVAAETPAPTGATYQVVVGSGVFIEDITLPFYVQLVGQFFATTIIGNITSQGAPLIAYITVAAFNKPALIQQEFVGQDLRVIQTTNLVLANFLSIWNDNTLPPSTNAYGVWLQRAGVNATRSGLFLTIRVPVNDAILIQNENAEFNDQLDQDELQVINDPASFSNGKANRAIMYNTTRAAVNPNPNAKIQLSHGVSKLTPNSGVKLAALFQNNGALNTVACMRLSIIQADAAQPNIRAIVVANGASTTNITSSYLELSGGNPDGLRYAIGAPDLAGGEPTVRILGVSAVADLPTIWEGEFALNAFSVDTSTGSLRFSGTIFSNITVVDHATLDDRRTYFATLDDRKILVTDVEQQQQQQQRNRNGKRHKKWDPDCDDDDDNDDDDCRGSRKPRAVTIVLPSPLPTGDRVEDFVSQDLFIKNESDVDVTILGVGLVDPQTSSSSSSDNHNRNRGCVGTSTLRTGIVVPPGAGVFLSDTATAWHVFLYSPPAQVMYVVKKQEQKHRDQCCDDKKKKNDNKCGHHKRGKKGRKDDCCDDDDDDDCFDDDNNNDDDCCGDGNNDDNDCCDDDDDDCCDDNDDDEDCCDDKKKNSKCGHHKWGKKGKMDDFDCDDGQDDDDDCDGKEKKKKNHKKSTKKSCREQKKKQQQQPVKGKKYLGKY